MPLPVSRRARLLDIAGLTLLVVGLACYTYAYMGLRELESVQAAPGTPAFAAVLRFDRMWKLSQLGIAIGAVGLVTAVVAAIVGRRGSASPT
jgi:hypothetical protein